MKRIAILIALALVLIPSMVSADELWVRNEGGLELVVEGQNLQVKQAGFYAFNPNYGENTAKIAAVSLYPEWVVVTGSITGWHIDYACNQRFENVTPATKFVKSAPVSTRKVIKRCKRR